MVEFARYGHTIIRVSIIVFLAAIIFGNVMLFLLSVLQANAPNAGEKFPSTEIEHYGFNKLDTDCSDASGLPRPVRYMNLTEKDLPQRYVYCSWKSKLTVWRSVSMVFLTIVACVLLGFLVKRSPANDSAAIWQDPKNVLRALLIPSGACGINMFFLMAFDGAAINQSQTWCAELALQSHVLCDYTPFILTAMCDMVLFIFWGLTTLFIFIRQLKKFRTYMQFQDEDENEMIPSGGTGWKKSGKSWVNKHLKKAKDRQKASQRE